MTPQKCTVLGSITGSDSAVQTIPKNVKRYDYRLHKRFENSRYFSRSAYSGEIKKLCIYVCQCILYVH